MEAPEQAIEVEYKEFKVSEFMEIRKKRQNLQGSQKALTESTGKEGKDYKTARNAGIAAAGASLLQVGKRRRFLIVILVLGVLAAITGAYYILKFLRHH